MLKYLKIYQKIILILAIIFLAFWVHTFYFYWTPLLLIITGWFSVFII